MIYPSASDISHLRVQARELKVTAVAMQDEYPYLWPWLGMIVVAGFAAVSGAEILADQVKKLEAAK